MTKTKRPTPNAKRTGFVRELGKGVKLKAEVAPCVFMYPGYPLQVQVTLHRHRGEHLGDASVVDRTKTVATYTAADVKRLVGTVRIVPCSRCSIPAFDPSTVQTNRNGLCEVCFMSDLEARLAAHEKAEQQKIAACDRRMKRNGMAVRVSAWVHPEGGGDDFPVNWYAKTRPTAVQVRRRLLQLGSACLDDYQIVVL